MKFRPRLETLDGRIVPDATLPIVPTPVNPGDIIGPIRETPAEKQERLDTLIDDLQCISDDLQGYQAEYERLLGLYNDLIQNGSQLIQLLGATAYLELLASADQQLTSAYNNLTEQIAAYNETVGAINQLIRDPELFPGGPPTPPMQPLPMPNRPSHWPPLNPTNIA